MLRTPAILLLLFSWACDPKVAGGGTAAPVGPGAAASRRGESCSATADCAAGLSCIDHVCREGASSRVGDFHWGAGRVALRDGKADRAAESLTRAVAQYETDGLPLPAELLCDTGAALRRKQGDAKAHEQAARFLHRCILASPPGSRVSRSAHEELALLEDRGLDPTLLGKDEPADAYLTRPATPTGPPALKVEASVPHKDKGYAAFMEVVKGRAAELVPCFAAPSQPGDVSVTVGLKYRQVLGDDDIVEGARLDVTGGSPCVRDVVQKSATEFAKDLRASSGSWTGELRIGVVPPAP